MNYGLSQERRRDEIRLGQAKNQAIELLKACYINNTPIGIITKLKREGTYYKELVQTLYELNLQVDEECFGREGK